MCNCCTSVALLVSRHTPARLGGGGPHASNLQPTGRALCLHHRPHRQSRRCPPPQLPATVSTVLHDAGQQRCPKAELVGGPTCADAGDGSRQQQRRQQRREGAAPIMASINGAACGLHSPTNLRGPPAVKALQPAGRWQGCATASCMVALPRRCYPKLGMRGWHRGSAPMLSSPSLPPGQLIRPRCIGPPSIFARPPDSLRSLC